MPIEEAPDDTQEEIHDTVLKTKPKLRRSVAEEHPPTAGHGVATQHQEPSDNGLPPVQEKKKPPPRTEKQKAALAKGREMSRLKALERRKKKAEETLASANESTEPPREEISTITSRPKPPQKSIETSSIKSDGWREFALYLAKDRDERKASKAETKKPEPPPRPPTPPPIIEKPLPVLKKKAIFS